MGVGRAFRPAVYAANAHPLLPKEAPLRSNWGRVFRHRIEGIAEDFIPDIVHLDELGHIVSVTDGDAIIMAQKLAREIGLGVGISSGAKFLGALMIQNELGKDAVVVTVFADDSTKC
jgi:cysteine synthase